MRGKCVVHVFVPEKFGITPAHAGEKQQSALGDFSGKGSPPHMRGKVAGTRHGVPTLRITPAHAGKSMAFGPVSIGGRDHPRVCGEKRAFSAAGGAWAGSPPHVWGKGAEVCNKLVNVGITPAYAGKSAYSSSSSGVQWNHPRVCGEKHIDHDTVTAQIGSPPRVRGKVRLPASAVRSAGITPACAGKRL